MGDYSTTDLTNAITALKALNNGERVTYVAKGDKMVRYQQGDQDRLEAYISRIRADLRSGEGKSPWNKVRFDRVI